MHRPNVPSFKKEFGIPNDVIKMLQWWIIDLMILMKGTGATQKQELHGSLARPETEISVLRPISHKTFVEAAKSIE